MTLTYPNYLQLDQLLDLQEPRSNPPEHDEMLFIVIHQVYELWFKLMLHEVEKVKQNFSSGDVFGAIHTLKRVRTIMKTLVGQLDVIETMTPMSFTSFRDRLDTASGFQSHQFREVEFVMGQKRQDILKYFEKNDIAIEILRKRLNERSLIDHFYDLLEKLGEKVPEEVKNRDVTLPAEANETVQASILKLYKNKPAAAILLELVTDFDEGFQEWRYRHIKLVERTIGNKHGTGGSMGVEFLKRSLFKPFFEDLWAIRHEL